MEVSIMEFISISHKGSKKLENVSVLDLFTASYFHFGIFKPFYEVFIRYTRC